MLDVRLLPVAPEHVLELARRIRAADLAEVLASGCASAQEGLETSMRDSAEAWTVLLNGEVAVIFGAVPIESSIIGGCTRACAWALTSTSIDSHPLTFLRLSKWFLRVLLDSYGELVALVDAGYQGALDWLEVLGFSLGPPRPHPATGLPFRVASIGGA